MHRRPDGQLMVVVARDGYPLQSRKSDVTEDVAVPLTIPSLAFVFWHQS